MKRILFTILLALTVALSACAETTIEDEIPTCDDGFELVDDTCVETADDTGETPDDNDNPQDDDPIDDDPVDDDPLDDDPVNDDPVDDDPVDPRYENITAGMFGYEPFTFDGLTREYILYLPDDLIPGSPLVFMLHGFSGNAGYMQATSGMNDLADLYGFAVVYPQGSSINGIPHWNADLDLSVVDDVGFLSALAAHLQTTYDLSVENTFIAGHSNGGFMAYTMACTSPATFQAIASFAGIMSGETWDTCATTEPVSVLHMHGTADPVVPDDGTMAPWLGWGGAPAVPIMLEYWQTRNALELASEAMVSATIQRFDYTSASNPYRVTYYRLLNMGHEWPQDDEIMPDDDDLNDTSQRIWQFFETVMSDADVS